jgi:hypothetical protein
MQKSPDWRYLTCFILRANYETLKRFTKNGIAGTQAVICVGDFKKEDIEAKVKQFFSVSLPAIPENASSSQFPKQENHLLQRFRQRGHLYTAMRYILRKKMRERTGTFADYRQGIIDQLLFSMMLLNRLQELTMKYIASFLYSLAQEGEFIGDVRVMIGVDYRQSR